MTRKLKTLAVALAAVFALSAVAASAASAAEFHSESEHTILKGKNTNTHKFITGAGTVECSEATFEGTASTKTTTTLTITPSYPTGKCTAFGLATHIDFATGGCDYEFTSHGHATLKCAAGGSVKITPTFLGVSVCTIDVEPGTYESVSYANGNGANGKGDVTVTANVKKIAYIETAGGSCGGEPGVTKEDGEYTGTTTVEGFDTEGAGTKIWWE